MPEVLAWSRSVVDPALRSAVGTLPALMRRTAAYHFGWVDADGRVLGKAAGGKAIRPALTLLAAAAMGGGDAVHAAVAVELVHNYSLVHDDVIDGDATRRHRATAWRVFGVSRAVLAGDALLSLAFDVLARSGHPDAGGGMRLLSTASMALVDGQVLDLAFEGRSDVGLAECRRMAEAKTGALLGCACGLGALFGGGRPEQVADIVAFGGHVGLAFQLVDDLLGIWGDSRVTGKPVYSDLRSRKKSLPVVAALTSGTPAGRELAGLYHREGALSEAEVVRAAELVEETGAREWCQGEAEAELGSALGRLRSACPGSQESAELEALARFIGCRDR